MRHLEIRACFCSGAETQQTSNPTVLQQLSFVPDFLTLLILFGAAP